MHLRTAISFFWFIILQDTVEYMLKAERIKVAKIKLLNTISMISYTVLKFYLKF